MNAAHHDLGYRALFAHPEMVRELITGFTRFKLLDGVALSAFERVNSDYVSGRPSARQGDVVWRVRIGRPCLDLYILLECQSRVDRCMALRMQTYAGLLCQDLDKRHRPSSEFRLPALLPVVFYNGAAPWNASLDLAQLLVEPPAEVADLQPSQRYALIDQQRLDRSALEANTGLLALLFRIELSMLPDVLHRHMRVLMSWFRSTSQTSLRNTVWTWWKALAARRTGNREWVELDISEGAEMETAMLSWAEQMQEIGRAEGKTEGKTEGFAEGQVSALRTTVGSLLRSRFGSLPAWAAQRIGQAGQAELERWFQRGLDAPELAAVFAEGT